MHRIRAKKKGIEQHYASLYADILYSQKNNNNETIHRLRVLSPVLCRTGRLHITLLEDIMKSLDQFFHFTLIRGFNQPGALFIDTSREALLVPLVEMLFEKVQEQLQDMY
jgi:hypothetical protein